MTDIALADSTERLAHQHASLIENHLITAIIHTDWEDTAVLDVVFARKFPAGPLTELDQTTVTPDTKIRIRRHTDRAPPLSDVGIPGRKCDAFRITRPLLETMRPVLEARGLADAML